MCVFMCVRVRAKSLQSCLTLCDPTDCSLPGIAMVSFSQGIFLTQGSNPFLMFPALVVRFFTTGATWEALFYKMKN